MHSEDPQPQDGAGGDVPDAAGAEIAAGHLVLRPDGYHWLAGDGRSEFGPFPSREEAMANMLEAMEEGMEPGESLEEAEQELGLANWVDTETGCLAEGLSTPHLVDEG